jgi:hypothetical protein
MIKLVKRAYWSAVLVVVAAGLIGLAVYTSAKWPIAILACALLVIVLRFWPRKDVDPREVANRAENLLNGTFGDWDVDDYEHLAVRDPQVREVWQKTLDVGGLPEEWIRLEEDKKSVIRSHS